MDDSLTSSQIKATHKTGDEKEATSEEISSLLCDPKSGVMARGKMRSQQKRKKMKAGMSAGYYYTRILPVERLGVNDCMNSPFIAHSLKKVVHYKNNLAMHCTNGNKFGVPHVRAETHSLFPSWVNLCCTFSHADSCIRITISCLILSLGRRMNGEMFYERNATIIGPILTITTWCMCIRGRWSDCKAIVLCQQDRLMPR